MSPPFVSEYKKSFALKRICQSFLGGLRLFSPPVFVCIQIILFTLPTLVLLISSLLLIGTGTSLIWKSATIGLSICSADLVLSILIYGLKRGSRANVWPNNLVFRRTSVLLGEEDLIEYTGILNFSTWSFVAPNVSAETTHLLSILFSSLAFTLCTPLIISFNLPAWLRGFGVFALCISRYSSVLSLPAEIATFDATHRRELYYRPIYAILLGAASFVITWSTGKEDSPCHLYCLIGLVILPIFWGLGILPPLDALVPWLAETALRTLGGCPSFYYFGTLVALVFGITFILLVFVSAQHRIFSLVLQCAFGFLLSIDLGAFIRMKSNYIFKSAIYFHQILIPLATALISMAAVASSIAADIVFWSHVEGMFLGICLSLSLLSILSQRFVIRRNEAISLSVSMILAVLEALITVLLHMWIAAEAQGVDKSQKRTDNRALHHLITYAFTIRAFSLSILEPRRTSLEMSIAAILRWVAEGSVFRSYEFTTVLFLVSIVRKRFVILGRYFGMMGIIAHADAVTPLLDNKFRVAVYSILTLPISIASLFLASISDGFTLNPIFSLPIFMVGFPRPTSFWKSSWFPRKTQPRSREDTTLDSTIYSEIAPSLIRAFVRRTNEAGMKLESGNCYIARYEDRLLFLRVVGAGWNFAYMQVKGLEMQEKTSCHNQESAWMDELFDKEFGDTNPSRIPRTCPVPKGLKSQLRAVSPLLSLQVPTYSESKSTLSNLITREEKDCLERMFFKSFAFLWIKRNPVLQASFRHRNSIGAIHTELPSEPDSGSDSDTTSLGIGDSGPVKTYFGHSGNNSLGIPLTPVNSIWTSSGSRSQMTVFPRIPGMEVTNGSSPGSAFWLNTSRSFGGENSRNVKNLEDSTQMNVCWVQKCLGDGLPTRAVRQKVEKLVRKIWKLVIGDNFEFEEIDTYQFFAEDFLVDKTFQLNKLEKGSILEIIIKAFRYASKLSLDEIYSSTLLEDRQDSAKSMTALEETFLTLTRLERDYQFCDQNEIPKYIEQKRPHIVSMTKNEQGMTQLRIFNYEPNGVEFCLGEMYKEIVEGIWGNLNCELLYLTSDDDERFSIQHDRYLMRNIVTQCANSPLGYSVYDSIFRINIFKNFSIEQL